MFPCGTIFLIPVTGLFLLGNEEKNKIYNCYGVFNISPDSILYYDNSLNKGKT